MFLLLQTLDKKKSFGVDEIHPFLLSTAAIEIFKPLTDIINLSITQGVFPDSLKVAKVIPIFKQGSQLLPNNYRPISVLPALLQGSNIKLASALPKSNHHFRSHLTHKNSKFYFRKINEVEMFLLFQNLDKKKSFGVDEIHPFLLSTAAIEIFKPLTDIINLSITQGVFPDSLKVAKVISIFKQGSRLLPNNYRPISVLPTLSKIF